MNFPSGIWQHKTSETQFCFKFCDHDVGDHWFLLEWKEAKRQLDSIHHEAARIITGGTKLCSLQKLLADLGWDSLQERRTKHKLVIFYKIINNLTPNYLQEFVPPLVQDGNPYRLRNSSEIRTIHTNTNLFCNSFQQLENGIT